MSLTLLRYRGREIRSADTAFIQRLIAEHPGWSRRRLSAELCRAWHWVQPNGALRDMVCRSLLLQLHRTGLIELPAKRFSPPNNVVARPAPAPGLPREERPRQCRLRELGPLEIRPVRRTAHEALFGQLMEAHHYLGYTQPVGEQLKYLVFAGTDPAEVRRRHLHLIAYNTRFLILPWVQVPHLASHLLGRVARRISADWQALYAHPIHLLETFIDPARFRGICYRAANWVCLGLTTGRGHNARTSRRDQPRKELWVYPLSADFRCHLYPPA